MSALFFVTASPDDGNVILTHIGVYWCLIGVYSTGACQATVLIAEFVLVTPIVGRD